VSKRLTEQWIDRAIAANQAEITRLRQLAPGAEVPCRYQQGADHGPHCWCGGRKTTRDEVIADLESEIEILDK
jgi:hypothetical protein